MVSLPFTAFGMPITQVWNNDFSIVRADIYCMDKQINESVK